MEIISVKYLLFVYVCVITLKNGGVSGVDSGSNFSKLLHDHLVSRRGGGGGKQNGGSNSKLSSPGPSRVPPISADQQSPAEDRIFFPPYKFPFWGLPYGVYSNGGFFNPGMFPFVPGGPAFPPYDGIFGGPFGPGEFPGSGPTPFNGGPATSTSPSSPSPSSMAMYDPNAKATSRKSGNSRSTRSQKEEPQMSQMPQFQDLPQLPPNFPSPPVYVMGSGSEPGYAMYGPSYNYGGNNVYLLKPPGMGYGQSPMYNAMSPMTAMSSMYRPMYNYSPYGYKPQDTVTSDTKPAASSEKYKKNKKRRKKKKSKKSKKSDDCCCCDKEEEEENDCDEQDLSHCNCPETKPSPDNEDESPSVYQGYPSMSMQGYNMPMNVPETTTSAPADNKPASQSTSDKPGSPSNGDQNSNQNSINPQQQQYPPYNQQMNNNMPPQTPNGMQPMYNIPQQPPHGPMPYQSYPEGPMDQSMQYQIDHHGPPDYNHGPMMSGSSHRPQFTPSQRYPRQIGPMRYQPLHLPYRIPPPSRPHPMRSPPYRAPPPPRIPAQPQRYPMRLPGPPPPIQIPPQEYAKSQDQIPKQPPPPIPIIPEIIQPPQPPIPPIPPPIPQVSYPSEQNYEIYRPPQPGQPGVEGHSPILGHYDNDNDGGPPSPPSIPEPQPIAPVPAYNEPISPPSPPVYSQPDPHSQNEYQDNDNAGTYSNEEPQITQQIVPSYAEPTSLSDYAPVESSRDYAPVESSQDNYKMESSSPVQSFSNRHLNLSTRSHIEKDDQDGDSESQSTFLNERNDENMQYKTMMFDKPGDNTSYRIGVYSQSSGSGAPSSAFAAVGPKKIMVFSSTPTNNNNNNLHHDNYSPRPVYKKQFQQSNFHQAHDNQPLHPLIGPAGFNLRGMLPGGMGSGNVALGFVETVDENEEEDGDDRKIINKTDNIRKS